jgi:hypothetical protein
MTDPRSQTPDLATLDDQLCFAIYSANTAINRMYRPYLSKLGLTYPQYIALLALWETDDVTVGALGKRLYLGRAYPPDRSGPGFTGPGHRRPRLRARHGQRSGYGSQTLDRGAQSFARASAEKGSVRGGLIARPRNEKAAASAAAISNPEHPEPEGFASANARPQRSEERTPGRV